MAAADGWWPVTRRWQVGDRLVLTLPVDPRLTIADPRVDAARGCVAIERGPLVYCVESADHPGQRLDDLVLDVPAFGSSPDTTADGLPEQIVAVRAPASRPQAPGAVLVAVRDGRRVDRCRRQR